MNILLNSAPKGQKANSPGSPWVQGCGLVRPERAKALPCFHAFALTGRRMHTSLTRGVAPGWGLAGLSGRITC